MFPFINRINKIVLFLFLIIFSGTLHAREFRHQYREGNQYRIVSEVDEAVLVNNEIIYQSRILNRIAVKILEGDLSGGQVETTYQISEQTDSGESYQWAMEDTVIFRIDSAGAYSEISPDQYLPSVRNVPLFPEENIEPGDRWYFPGEEVLDLAPNFGIDYRLHLNFNVFYEYKGTIIKDNRELDVIKINYNIYTEIDLSSVPEDKISDPEIAPKKVTGSFNQILYWDNNAGLPYEVEENFIYEFTLKNKVSYVFRGTSSGKAFYAVEMEKEEMEEEIQKDLEGMEGVSVEKSDEGITLTLENIQFKPDSAELLPSEMAKLEKISSILNKYPDRDIMIVGHAARLGHESWLQELSEMRAASVAQYFIDRGVRSKSQIVTKGMGSKQPVGDNSTEEGRRKNRRVEIIILEN